MRAPENRAHPALQVRTQQRLGPGPPRLAALDHAQPKALPALADDSAVVGDFQVVDQKIALIGPFLGPSRNEGRSRPAHAGDEPIHADRQDRGLGDASLDRVDRRVARGGIAEHQLGGK